ncbi:hypothetical protein TRAPUB_7630, partial [Trametes pubescens]
VFDTKTWTRIRVFPLKGCIADADITADGRTMVISNMTTGFDLYDVESMSSMGTYKHDVAALRMVPVTFIHGGNAVASSSTVGEAHLWDVKTCCGIHTLPLQQKDHVLAMDAFYDRRKDRFFIATAIYNPTTEDAVVIWKTERLGGEENVKRSQTMKAVFNASLGIRQLVKYVVD